MSEHRWGSTRASQLPRKNVSFSEGNETRLRSGPVPYTEPFGSHPTWSLGWTEESVHGNSLRVRYFGIRHRDPPLIKITINVQRNRLWRFEITGQSFMDASDPGYDQWSLDCRFLSSSDGRSTNTDSLLYVIHLIGYVVTFTSPPPHGPSKSTKVYPA